MNKDKALLKALKNSYNQIIALPDLNSYDKARADSAQHIQDAFSSVGVQIKGSENLPDKQGVIFIYNHLHNHPFFTVDNDFQITLDSHFISSMILNKYYDNPGTRVVRHSLENEINHKLYYSKFNYIRVFAKNYIPKKITKKEVKSSNGQFYKQASEVLKNNTNIVFSPEGSSYFTEDSPGSFLNGIFKFASGVEQPWIVPLVMVNFDKLPSKATYKCQIMPPFRMQDYGVYSPESETLNKAVRTINNKYKKWVRELSKEDKNFDREITVLKRKISQKKNKKELLVFYGSSTIRLWKNSNRDFSKYNTLNLGFGGAFIHSLDDYFDELFHDLCPKHIVLYLGGNDLTLGLSASKIVSEILKFMGKIHLKFPDAMIYNISIKPSFERKHELAKIKKINAQLKLKVEKLTYVHQIDFFELLIENNKIKKSYFLKDGLHLNENGYSILKKTVKEALYKFS